MTPKRTAPVPNVAVRPLLSSQAEALFRSVLSSVEFGIMVTDLDHVALACNARFGELWGVDIDRVVNSDPESVREMARLRIADYEGWLRNLEDVYGDPHQTHHDELVLSSPHLVLNRSANPVYDQQGNLTGRIWTFSDVTTEHRLRRMRDVVHFVSTEYDPDPAFVYRRITERAGEFYGSLCLLSIRDGDILHFRATGGPDAANIPTSQNQLADSYCQFCLAQNRPTVVQNAANDPQYANLLPAQMGLTRYAGVPIYSPDGSALGTLCILDRHSDVLMDEEDLRFLQILAVRIGSEISREGQLKRLQRDLEESHQNLIQNEKLAITGTLSASIAHDIRNILSTISLQLTMGDADPPKALARVRDQLERFDLMAHRLLSYARPNRVLLQPVDVREVVLRVIDLLDVHLEMARTHVEMNFPSDLPAVAADPARLDHLFVNLGLNAIQAMAAGGTLRFEGEVSDDQVVIYVQDTGPGMTDTQIEGLFSPFKTSKSGGFGLGLFSCRQITRECGGDLTVESKIGTGTRFRISLRRYA